MVILFPIVVGVYILSPEFIRILSGDAYIQAQNSLRILSITLLFSTFASFFATSLLIPLNKEKNVLIATLIGAIVNIILNILIIPIYGFNGAAVTTLFSEAIVFFILFISLKEKSLYKKIKELPGILMGCLGIILVLYSLKKYYFN